MSNQTQAGSWATICPTCCQRYRWQGALVPIPKCPQCHPAKPDAAPTILRPPEVQEVLTEAEEILRLCDEELPEAGWDYGESVAEQTRAIVATIERTGRATPKQATAINNMLAGVLAWIHE